MSKLAIVYWTGTGNTESMAELIREGAASAGVEASLFEADEFNDAMAADYEAIAFGCPSMGDEELEDGTFAPMFQSVIPVLGNKKIALFGSFGWGEGDWMRKWEADCAAAGVPLAAESVMSNYAPDADAADACRALGKALAA